MCSAEAWTIVDEPDFTMPRAFELLKRVTSGQLVPSICSQEEAIEILKAIPACRDDLGRYYTELAQALPEGVRGRWMEVIDSLIADSAACDLAEATGQGAAAAGQGTRAAFRSKSAGQAVAGAGAPRAKGASEICPGSPLPPPLFVSNDDCSTMGSSKCGAGDSDDECESGQSESDCSGYSDGCHDRGGFTASRLGMDYVCRSLHEIRSSMQASASVTFVLWGVSVVSVCVGMSSIWNAVAGIRADMSQWAPACAAP